MQVRGWIRDEEEVKINESSNIPDEHNDAKVFWRNQLIGILIDKFADQAYNSDDNIETKAERVQNFQQEYKSEVQRLIDR